jgi:1,4-dihydroxy-6-naphthoate synthase
MLKFGISPCPNDTFIFFGIIEKKVNTQGLNFDFVIEDVETLNSLCLEKALDISKISSHAFYYLKEDYEVIPSGGALSEQGPVVITKNPEKLKNLSTIKLALPGRFTTASLLMWFYWQKNFTDKKYTVEFMPFYEIIDKVTEQKADLGVLIHEGRFIYSLKGLHLVADLGEFWIKECSLPIPLGCIVCKKSLSIKETVNRIIKESLHYAYCHFDEAVKFTKKYSQELNEEVIKMHIQTYVNEFSFDMGQKGIMAINELIKKIPEDGIWS